MKYVKVKITLMPRNSGMNKCYFYTMEHHIAMRMKLYNCNKMHESHKWNVQKTKPDTKESSVYNCTPSQVPLIQRLKTSKTNPSVHRNFPWGWGRMATKRKHKRNCWGAGNTLSLVLGACLNGCVPFVIIH